MLKLILKLAVIGFVVFLMVMPLINTFGLLNFRKSNTDILSAISEVTNFDAKIDTLDWKGRRVVYASVKHPEKIKRPAVIFAHGSPGSLDAYLSYLKSVQLLEHADLYALDRPGYGNSNFGKTIYSLKSQAEAIRIIITSENLAPVILVGHSLGCSVIARYAIEYSDQTAGLVLVAAPLDPDLEPSVWWRKIVDFPLFRPFTPVSLRVCNQEIIPLKNELLEMTDKWDRISCPVVFVHGAKDELVPVGNVSFAEERLVSSPKVVLDIAETDGHFILWTKPEKIIDHILDLLED